jgi:cobalt-zinc-cadmium efflux system outer membrane protein
VDQRALLDGLRHDAGERSSGEPWTPAAAEHLAGGLTEDHAVTLALLRNPDLRVFRMKRQVAKGAVVAAAAIPNPSLKIEALHLQEFGTSSQGLGLGLQWSPPQPVEWSARRRKAEARLREVEQEILEREWQLATEVRSAHATLLELEEQGRLLESTVTRRRRIVDLVQRRMQLGAATRLDLNLATLALAQAERDRDETEARHAVTARAFHALLGAAEAQLVLRGKAAVDEGDAEPPDERSLEDQSVAARPSLRAAKERLEQREQSVRREHAQRWPWIQLSAAPRFRLNESAKYEHDFLLGVELSLPLFNWNRGGILVAEAERSEEREKMVAQLAALRRDIGVARARIEGHRAALRHFRKTVLPALGEYERVLDLAIRGGQVDLVAVLAAEDVVLRHRRAYAELLLEQRKAWLALERAVGGRVGRSRR